MYVILDKNLNRVGMLDANGGFGSCPFWGDEISVQLADQDSDVTLDDQSESFNTADPHANTKNWNHTMPSIYIPYGYPESEEIVQGAHLAYQDNTNNHWYVMRLTDIKDVIDTSGTHYKSCVGVNLAIWDLIHTKLDDLKATMASCEDAFRALLAKTSWTIGTVEDTGGTAQITFSKSENAQAKLQTLCQTYDCEVDAYIEFDSAGQPTTKVIDIMHELGVDDGVPVNYGDELISMERLSTDTNLYTRLYPYNSNGDGIEDVNGGIPYVENETANDEYSTRIVGVDGPKYLEGAITSKSIDNHGALRDWAKSVLSKFDHPRINYSIQIGSDFTAGLGDHIRIKDMEMLPKAAVDARVIQKTFSQADPTQDQVIVGEFATVKVVTPGLIENLQKIMNQIDAVKAAQADASSVKPVALTPDGDNFTDTTQTKRLILQAWEGHTNISSYIDSKGFIWRRHNPDGTVDTSYEQTGYLVQAPYNAVGTLSGTIETGYIQDNPEIKLDTANIKRVGNFLPTNTSIATIGRQYMCQLSNGGYIGSQAVHGDTLYMLQDSTGYVVSAMTVVKGGHGASFDVEEADGKIYIWGSVGTDTEPENYSIARFPYVGGATLQSTDSRIERYITENKYIRVSVDLKHGYVLTSDFAGNEEVLKLSDVKAGNYNVQYSINITNYGFDLKKQTYQSQTLSFPYVIFHSGNMNMRDKRMMYAVNVVHGGQEFAVDELNDIDLGITDDNIEPETCHLMYNTDNELLLLLTFHCRPANDQITSNQVTRVITIPIITRPEAPVIDEMEMEDDDNGDD